MKKRNYLLLIIFFALLLCQNVYALETAFPEIFNYTITEESDVNNYVAYFFALAIAVGGVLVFLVLVMAGLEFVLSGGDPGKVSEAKSKATNAFIGIIILFSSYMILNTINPAIIGDQDISLEQCEGGGLIITIQKSLSDGGTSERKACIYKSEMDIPKKIGLKDTETISDMAWDFPAGADGTIHGIWSFPETYYEGTATTIFQDLSGVGVTPISTQTGSLPKPDMKSIYFMSRSPGIYLYDLNDFKIENSFPLFTNSSISDLNAVNFDNLASSLLISPSKITAERYGAVLFDSPSYQGKCSVTESSTYLNFNDLQPVSREPFIGDKKLSSIIVYRADYSKLDRGTIIFYNNVNCKDSLSGVAEVKKCEVDIISTVATGVFTTGQFQKIADICPPDFDNIISIKINGSGGVVIRADNNECRYFDKSMTEGEACIPEIISTGLWGITTNIGIKPQSLAVFPLD